MVKIILATSGVIGACLCVLAMLGGCGIGDAIMGSLFCAILLAILGFFLWGLFVALRRISGYVSAGLIAVLFLFWQHVLPGVCVEVICHALGVKK